MNTLGNIISWEGENIFDKKENLEFIEQINNIKVYKRNSGTYKLTFDNDKNYIIYKALSYEILDKLNKKDKNNTYLKIITKDHITQNNEVYVYKIPKNIENNQTDIDFEAYTLSGKFKISSEYNKKEDTCYVTYVKTPIISLNTQEKEIIYKLRGMGILYKTKKKLFNLLKK